jgi:Ca2+-binding RTX toxin-like protein
MAIRANFDPATGVLTETGDNLGNTITTSLDATGQILVNGGTVPVSGGTATVANTATIQVFGKGGNDTITLDESNGLPLPAAQLSGGAGNDTITGGSGADQLSGDAGNDTLLGKGGDDILAGGAGDDVLTGDTGSDQLFGDAGDDRIIWNPGDGSDFVEGGAGTDTAAVNGGNVAETFSITAKDGRVLFDRLEPTRFTLNIGTTENLVLRANGGDDVIEAGNGLAGLIQLTLDGGAGNDTITGGDGDDVLIGGTGNDQLFGGAGNDVFVWNPGDGSDVVEGQAGIDRLVFNGSDLNENFDISANGSRTRLSRDVGNVVMDLNGVEHIQLAAVGGADTITVNDLTGTEVKQVAIDLAATPGTGQGDGQPDSVTVNGTGDNDQISIASSGASVVVNGLPAKVTIDGAEAGNDSLVINGLNGNDTIDASALKAEQIKLVINGGAGNDTIVGSKGNDVVNGGTGSDVASLGAGDDVFVWNPGDGSDVVDGQKGTDTLVFNGANLNENFDISANGRQVRLLRDIGTVTMDLDNMETIDLNAKGGADTITVNDLTGTDVSKVNIDLAGSSGGGDGEVDTIVINQTNHADAIKATNNNGVVTVTGLATELTISNFEADDRIVINGQLLGQFMASTFVTPGDGHSATPITDQPSSQQLLLTQPHA